MERGLRTLGADAGSVPFLLSLLGAETDDPAIRGMAAEARRRYTFEALRALTIAGSARRPIVFAVEDLHWVDPASQDFLRYLAENSTRAAVLLLVTHRPGYTPPWADRSYYSPIALAPLSEGESERVVESVLRVPSLPAAVKALICQKAEGNPFYLEEITRSFVDTGILARADGGYVLARPVTPQDVPDTVQGVIMARIDRLADTRKRTIQTAAVIGREFGAHLLGRIADVEGASMNRSPTCAPSSSSTRRRSSRTWSTSSSTPSSRTWRTGAFSSRGAARFTSSWDARSRRCTPTGSTSTSPSSPITSPRGRCGRRRSRTRAARGTAPGRSSPTGRRSTSTPRRSRPRPG